MLERFRLHLLSVLFLAACLVLAAALAEIGLWIWAHVQASESRDHVISAGGLPVRLRPHYQGVFWSIPFRTNNLGFRDEPDIPVPAAPGERRVLSLGDSIGFGLGVPAEAHYTKVAERLLAGSGLRIFNAGGLGYCPSCYAVWLRREGLELGPELVVLETELMNDVTDEALLRWVEGDDGGPARVIGGRYVTSWDGALLGTYARWDGWWERTYVYTQLARRTLYLLRRLEFLSGPAHPAYYSLGFDAGLLTGERLEAGWRRLEGAIETAYRRCRDRGVDFLLLVMPARWIFEDAGSYSEEARRARERMLAWCRDRGIPHIDMAPHLERAGGAELYFDFAHLTVEGNRVVGEVLADYLRGSLKE